MLDLLAVLFGAIAKLFFADIIVKW